MKVIVLFFVVAIVAFARAAPQVAFAKLTQVAPQVRSKDADAVVLRYDSDNIGIDGYNYAYETSNGISAQEQGQVQNVGSENEAIAVRGSFSYTGDDGVVYTVNYVADENGFQAQGAHLPQAP